jgi:hypothetical protein
MVWAPRSGAFLKSLDDVPEDSRAFLQSLDDVPEDDGLLGAMACYEIYLRMCDMYVAYAQIRGDEADACEYRATALQAGGHGP